MTTTRRYSALLFAALLSLILIGTSCNGNGSSDFTTVDRVFSAATCDGPDCDGPGDGSGDGSGEGDDGTDDDEGTDDDRSDDRE